MSVVLAVIGTNVLLTIFAFVASGAFTDHRVVHVLASATIHTVLVTQRWNLRLAEARNLSAVLLDEQMIGTVAGAARRIG